MRSISASPRRAASIPAAAPSAAGSASWSGAAAVRRPATGLCRVRRSPGRACAVLSRHAGLAAGGTLCRPGRRAPRHPADRARSAGLRPLRLSSRPHARRVARGRGRAGRCPGHRAVCRSGRLRRRPLRRRLRLAARGPAHAGRDRQRHRPARRPRPGGRAVARLAGRLRGGPPAAGGGARRPRPRLARPAPRPRLHAGERSRLATRSGPRDLPPSEGAGAAARRCEGGVASGDARRDPGADPVQPAVGRPARPDPHAGAPLARRGGCPGAGRDRAPPRRGAARLPRQLRAGRRSPLGARSSRRGARGPRRTRYRLFRSRSAVARAPLTRAARGRRSRPPENAPPRRRSPPGGRR